MVVDIATGITGVRIGFDEAYATQGVDPELAAAVVAGVRVLESLGATIVPVQLPDLAPYLAAWPTLCTAEAVAAHAATYPAGAMSMAPGFAAGWTWVPACRGLTMPTPTTFAPPVTVCCVPYGNPLMRSPAPRCRHRRFPSRQRDSMDPCPMGF